VQSVSESRLRSSGLKPRPRKPDLAVPAAAAGLRSPTRNTRVGAQPQPDRKADEMTEKDDRNSNCIDNSNTSDNDILGFVGFKALVHEAVTEALRRGAQVRMGSLESFPIHTLSRDATRTSLFTVQPHRWLISRARYFSRYFSLSLYYGLTMNPRPGPLTGHPNNPNNPNNPNKVTLTGQVVLVRGFATLLGEGGLPFLDAILTPSWRPLVVHAKPTDALSSVVAAHAREQAAGDSKHPLRIRAVEAPDGRRVALLRSGGSFDPLTVPSHAALLASLHARSQLATVELRASLNPLDLGAGKVESGLQRWTERARTNSSGPLLAAPSVDDIVLAAPLLQEASFGSLAVAPQTWRVLFLLGAPGSGLRSIAMWIGRHYNLTLITMEDLLWQAARAPHLRFSDGMARGRAQLLADVSAQVTQHVGGVHRTPASVA
jgi:hypothetical protein